MPRPSKPWFRDFDGWWYATITPGSPPQKLVKGKENKADAETTFHQLKATRTVSGGMDRGPCAGVLERFLDHSQTSHSPQTYAKYSQHLNWFSAFCGRVPVRNLIPNHVTRYLAGK